jgi:phage terminase large subunit
VADQSNSQKKRGINGYSPRKWFVDFHNRSQRWAVMVCHRRAGKTVACIADLVLSCLATTKVNARFAYVAPLYKQAKDVAWMYVKDLTSDIPGMSYNESELRADFPNGARIRLYGADNPDGLRGLYMDGVILDEYADMRPSVWGEVIRPLLADRAGWAVFIGTPKGHNAFWNVWEMAQNDKRWFSLVLRASASKVLSKEELEDSARGMSADQYAQEFECSFDAAIKGAYYGAEMLKCDQEKRIADVPYDYLVPVHTAWDLGYSDDTAIWFYQVIAGEVRVINHYNANGKDIKHYADIIKSKPYKYGTHHLPHDARAKTLASGGKSTIEQLGEYLDLSNLSIVPMLSVQDGIQAARLMFPRIWFDSVKCADGIESLRQYQRAWDEKLQCFRDNPLHDWTSHDADAFRMMAVAWKEEYSEKPADKPLFPISGTKDGFTIAPLDVLWRDQPIKRSGRI